MIAFSQYLLSRNTTKMLEGWKYRGGLDVWLKYGGGAGLLKSRRLALFLFNFFKVCNFYI